jgi:hypothetical protein
MKLGMGFVVFTVSPVRCGGRSQGGCHTGLRKRRLSMFHLPIRDLRRLCAGAGGDPGEAIDFRRAFRPKRDPVLIRHVPGDSVTPKNAAGRSSGAAASY